LMFQVLGAQAEGILVEYNGRLMAKLQLSQKPIKKGVVARHS
jgi:hypothetical protein